MSERLKALGSDPMIQNFAQEISQSRASKIADFIAPTVEVPSLNFRYKIFDAKHRYKIPETKYVPGEPATRIGFTATDAAVRLQPRALDHPLTDLEQDASDEALRNAFEEGIELLSDAAELSREVEVLDAAIAATSLGANINFESDSVNPVKELDKKILSVLKLARNGAQVRIAMGTTAWLHIKNNPLIRGQISDSKEVRTPSLEQFRGMLIGNPEVAVSMMVKDVGKEGKAASFDWVLDDTILVFACNPQPTRMDPSFMKTFRLRNKWMRPDSYEFEDRRGEAVKMDWCGLPAVTNSPAALRFKSAA